MRNGLYDKTNNIDKKSRRIFVEIFLNKSFHFNSKYKIKLFFPNFIHKGSILDIFKKNLQHISLFNAFFKKIAKKNYHTFLIVVL
jgi:hypothetical protein